VALSALCACSSQTANPTQFVLNGPSDLAFGCTGQISSDSNKHAFPPASCGPIAPTLESPDAGVPDAGGGVPTSATPIFLIPEKTPGTLHVATLEGGAATYIDQDPFAPGLNGVAVGRLPVSVAVTSDGCWAVVANSGSCDLAVVDVLRASVGKEDPIAARSGVAGLPARPGDIARPTSLPVGTFPLPTCDSPSGTVWVSYPSCHLVARVDLATFQVVDGIRFVPGAAPEIVGPDVTCPAECTDNGGGATGTPDEDAGAPASAASPVTLAEAPTVIQHRVTSGTVTTKDHASATTGILPPETSDRLYLVYVQARDAERAVPTSTIAGAGLTWTAVGDIASGDATRRVSLFYATGHADGTGVAITHSAASADATEWIVEEVLGANLAEPIRNVKAGTGTGSTATLDLGPFAGNGNGTVVGVGVDVVHGPPTVVQTINPLPGWTEVDEVGSGTNAAGSLEVQFSAGPLRPGAGWQQDTVWVAISAELELRSRLYIGAAGSGSLVIADLDSTGAPLGVSQLPLEGATGIRRLAVSRTIPMGDTGQQGDYNFLYAVADDEAIHVADVTTGRTPSECDAQIDRHFMHSITNASRLACFRLGDPQNPPRRPEANGPGIRLPNGVLPIDVQFTQVFGTAQATPDPNSLRGDFAVATALGPTTSPPRGVAYWINVNDTDYPDFQHGISLGDPDIALGVPHSVRDHVPFRWIPSTSCVEDNYPDNDGPYRLESTFPRALDITAATNANGKPGDEFTPNLHRVAAEKFVATSATNERDVCAGADVPVYELSQIAPRALRSALWGDVTLTSLTEQFTITWEGPLAPEDFHSRKSGGRVTAVGGDRLAIDAAGANLCTLGPKPHDMVRLLGCTGNGDCAFDETCYVHPAAPIGVSGMCVPTDRVVEFSADCQALLTTVRRYSIVDVNDDHVTLAARPRTLPETPIDGCTDADQCMAIQDKVLSIREAAAQPPVTLTRHQFTCGTDEFMGGPPRCIETCDSQHACEPGATCEASTGRCVLGPIPQEKCVAPLQRYELRAGDAFTVVSSVAGYRQPGVQDPTTRECIADPTKSPLLVARFGRNEPLCTDTGVTALTPNPCTLPPPVLHTNSSDDKCPTLTSGFGEPIVIDGKLCYRDTRVVRIRMPGMSFDVADVSLPLEGFPDVRYSPIQFGFAFQIEIAGGGFPFIETAVQADLPSRVRVGLNGEPWVIDSASARSSGGAQGQIILLTGSAAPDAVSPVRLF
jgi:hypothetical protein